MSGKVRIWYKSRQARTLLLLGVIIVVAGITIGYRFMAHHTTTAVPVNSNRPVNSVDYGPPGHGDNTQNEQRKSSPTASPTLTTNNSANTGQTSALSTTITSVSVNSDNKLVHVGTLVNNTSDGDCKLTITKDAVTKDVATSQVKQEPSYYDCGVYNVPFANFPESGKWTLTLTVTSDGKQATNTWGQEVTIPAS